MKKGGESLFRRAMLLLATTLAALGVALGLPVKKAIAASLGGKIEPAPGFGQPPHQLKIIQPRYVNPTAVRLLQIAQQALSNGALAERIFREPDAVAAQYHLSNSERLVLRHMDRQQFQTARNDATRVVAQRLARAGSMRMPPGATNTSLITERMIVGRAILAAVGRSYLSAADASGCCPWSKSIELGVNSDPAYYNAVFQRTAGESFTRPAVEAPRSGVESPQLGGKALGPGVNRLK
jgi:hypothetical protein